MTPQQLFVVFSMDCEPARTEVTEYGHGMSGSGPIDYTASERSIRGYATIAREHGYPLTLFVHPEVATAHPDLLLELQSQGCCLGLHLHPYKLQGQDYRFDLGYYSAEMQREIISRAVEVWERVLGRAPLYFRGGVFSANDNTFAVLRDLGFKGGSLSCPGRVLTEAYSVWAGAERYPHRANLNFRQAAGVSNFVEVPISVAYSRPTVRGHRGEQGYEWPYIPYMQYRHADVVRDVIDRIHADQTRLGCFVTDTHNDMDYSNPDHHATRNLRTILESIESFSRELHMQVVGATVEEICARVLE